MFRSFATLVFVTSCHACFVVLPHLKCFRRLELRLNCFRRLELRLNCFRILELRLKCFRSLKLRLNCFRSLELRSTCFRNLELRLFRDFMSRLFRGLPRLFRDFVSRLVIYPRVTVCPRLFRSLELRWFFVAFGLRLTCRFRAALVIRCVSVPL